MSDLSQNQRRAFGCTFIVNSGDLNAVDRPAIASPDLVARWEQGADENEVDQDSIQGSGAVGCTDYPVTHD